ncbi:hypothetical protein N0V93_001721 [Gnomoniopsis smithogilvyi]|uniref:Cytochrome P450 n=1 Tax=Gnomoniopsis smithogilvyi TaxID=1191159 RepID=A0A9W9D2Z3_9PEZI|nr:hypothetical protein N0V93_001721 [Gnomoniopsis smithogilvyi]
MHTHDVFTTLWYITEIWWALCAIGLALLIHQWIRVEQRELSSLPGTTISKWTSIPVLMHLVKGTQPKYVHSLFVKYGPVVRLGPNQVAFSDVAALEQIYSTQESFVKSSLYGMVAESPVPNVLSTAENGVHRQQRELMMPGLSQNAVDCMYTTLSSRVALAIQRMGEETNQNGFTDIYKWWTLMMADIMGEVTFGQSLGLLEEGKKDDFMEALTDSSMLSILRMTLPFVIPLAEYVSLGPANKAVKAQNKACEHAKVKLARHREDIMSGSRTAQVSIFGELFSAEEQGLLTQEEVVSNAITVLANGADPTANTLTYLVWAVCRRPAVRVQLLEEIDSLPHEFEHGHLKQLSYLNQVIEETLRLYPAVGGGLLRTVPSQGATIVGHRIPPGTIVSCQAYSLHRDPNIFANPDVFHPDRWDAPTTAMKTAMMAWGGGERACIGLDLARMTLRLSTAYFFKAFQHASMSTQHGMSDLDMEPVMMKFTEPKGQRCLFECR